VPVVTTLNKFVSAGNRVQWPGIRARKLRCILSSNRLAGREQKAVVLHADAGAGKACSSSIHNERRAPRQVCALRSPGFSQRRAGGSETNKARIRSFTHSQSKSRDLRPIT